VSAPEQPTGMSDSGTGVTDSGVSSISPVTTSETAPEQQPLNPAWEPVLKDLPEYFHPKAKEHFRTWDDNYRKLEAEKSSLADKYKPYEQYLEVDPQTLQYGLGMLQRVQQDPLALYQALQDHVRQLGLLKEEQQNPPDSQEPTDLGVDPKLQEFEKRQQQLDERQQQIDAYIQQQVYEQQVSGYEKDIDTKVQEIIKKYGDKSVDVPDLLQRMYVQTQRGNGNFDAEAAYQEQLETFKRLYAAQSQGRPAPNVLPTNGTIAPSSEVKPEDMNEDQRKAYFKHLLDLANAGG